MKYSFISRYYRFFFVTLEIEIEQFIEIERELIRQMRNINSNIWLSPYTDNYCKDKLRFIIELYRAAQLKLSLQRDQSFLFVSKSQ